MTFNVFQSGVDQEQTLCAWNELKKAILKWATAGKFVSEFEG